MGEGIWIVILMVLGLVAVALVETVAYVSCGGWLDVRSSRTAEEVREDLEEYGPDVPGLRLELLPEDERRAVLEARRRSAAERKRTTEPRTGS